MKTKAAPSPAKPAIAVRRSPRPRRSHASKAGPAFTLTRDSPSTQQAQRIQPRLQVGAADDPLEREADAMAERVVSMSAPDQTSDAPSPPSGPSNSGEASAQPLRRSSQPGLETLEVTPPVPSGQEEVTLDKNEDVPTDKVEGADVAELESGAPEDTGSEAPDDAAGPSGDDAVQAERNDSGGAAVGREGGAAPSDVTQAVRQPGAGRPLPEPVRAFMEPRFGTDFSDVRIHDSQSDQRTASRIGARAFTHGRRIWMGPGESVEDKRLMAHELTHVVQQTKRRPAKPDAESQRITRSGAEPTVRRAGWLATKAEKYARHVPGYTLLCVLLGKSPITGDRVARTAVNLIGGFLGLLPGGTLLFDKLQETRALQNAFDWVSTRLSQLNITWSRVSRLIDKVWDIFPTLSPLEKITNIFAPLVRDIKTFAGEVWDKVLGFIVQGALKLAGSWGAKIWGIMQKIGSAVGLIFKDPLGFALNLVKSVVGGFKLFSQNIVDHLKRGLLGWLFGALAGAGLQLPDKLDLKGLLSIGLQVLGISYDRFRKKLVKRMGPNGEKKVSFIEKSVEVVKLLVTKGFMGVWQKLLGYIDNFKQMLIGGIQTMVMTTIVQAGISWLAGLSNPVGAIVRVIKAIYDLIVAFLERLEQIKAVAEAIFSSFANIAAGNVGQATKFIEKTIGATVPVVISFLAALLGLGGISKSIKDIIKKIQKPVDKAMDKMIKFVVDKAKKLMSKLLKKVNSKRKKPGAKFKIGKVSHTISIEPSGKKSALFVSTDKTRLDSAAQRTTQSGQAAAKKKLPGAQEVTGLGNKMTEAVVKNKAKVESIPPKPSSKTSGRKPTSDGQNVTTEVAATIQSTANQADQAHDTVEPTPEDGGKKGAGGGGGNGGGGGGAAGALIPIGPLIRFAVLRANFEGDVKGYNSLVEWKTKAAKDMGMPELSKQYEADHIPTRQVLKVFRNNFEAPLTATPGGAGGANGPAASPAGPTSAAQTAQPTVPTTRIPANSTPTKQTANSKPSNKASNAAPSAAAPAPPNREFGRITKANMPDKNFQSFPAIITHGSAHKKKRLMKGEVDAEAEAVKTAFLAGDIPGTKKAVQQHMLGESQRTVKAYEGDPLPQFADRVTKVGLEVLWKRAMHDFAINVIKKDGKPVSARSKPKLQQDNLEAKRDKSKDLYFDPAAQKAGLKNPNFADQEGNLFTYNGGRNDNTVMGYIELDHIVDKSFPNTIKGSKGFNKVHDIFPASQIGPRPNIKDQSVVEGDPIADYNENQAKSVLIAASVHATVDQIKPKAVKTLIKAEATTQSVNTASSDADVIKAAREALRETIRKRTEAHISKVEEGYGREKAKVVAYNKIASPGGGQRAAPLMDAIIARVKISMASQKDTSLNLIKPVPIPTEE